MKTNGAVLMLSSRVFEADDKKHKLESWKNKLASYMASKSSVVPQGISTAMDARLEGSLDLAAELRLKVSRKSE